MCAENLAMRAALPKVKPHLILHNRFVVSNRILVHSRGAGRHFVRGLVLHNLKRCSISELAVKTVRRCGAGGGGGSCKIEASMYLIALVRSTVSYNFQKRCVDMHAKETDSVILCQICLVFLLYTI